MAPAQNEDDAAHTDILAQVQSAIISDLKNATFRESMIEAAQASPNFEITFEEARVLHPTLVGTLSEVASPLTADELLTRLTYRELPYYPVFYVPNAANLSASLPEQYVVALGAQLDKEDSEDWIPAVFVDRDQVVDIELNEAAALSAEVPVFIVTSSTDYIDIDSDFEQELIIEYEETSQKTANTGSEFRWTNARINGSSFRYESSGASDVRALTTLFNHAGNPVPSFGNFQSEQTQVFDFSPGQVSSQTTINPVVSNPPAHIFNSSSNVIPDGLYADFHFLLWNSFEWDWWAGLKGMPNALGGGQASCTAWRQNGRMKYANEWYVFFAWDCSGANPRAFDLESIPGLWNYAQLTSNKGILGMSRYQ